MISNLLLIDDDEDVVIYTKYLVEKSGLVQNFHSSNNGEEGLQFLKNNEAPDIILLDINMPKMNGWEFIEEYNKLSLTKPIMIIMLTVSVNPDDKKKAEDSNIQFMNKPLTPEKLEHAISTNFPQKNTG